MKTSKYTLLILVTLLLSIRGFSVKHIVHVGSFYFTPSSLNVNVGDTIRWVWDGGSHTTTSSTIPAGAATWDSPITSGLQSFEYAVTKTGVHNYVCTPHASMGQVGSFTAAGAAPTLSVSPSNRNVPASNGTTTFTVTSNSSWTATSSASWCAVTSSGSGNGTIFADYTENTSLNSRTATVTVSVSGLPNQTVTVTQAGATATLSVSPSNQQVTAQSGTTSFTVSSNTSWTSVSDASWCTVTGGGSGNGSLHATFTENTSFQVRTANITVTVLGLAPVIVTVTQDASTVGLSENNNFQTVVAPNPSAGVFMVKAKSDSNSGKSAVTVTDITGHPVFSGDWDMVHDLKLDLTGNPSGMYFLCIKSGKDTSVQRLLLSNN
jgi:plastocyanin